MLSVIILTKDEEADLPGCLSSLSWCDDIHVVDSGSEDRTVDIALQAGALLQTNPFRSFAQQRNWALDHCPAEHEWVLFLDADEQSTPAFEKAVKTAITVAPLSCAGFYCCWKTILDGRWLKRSDNYPKWQFRLIRLGSARFADSGHGQKESNVNGLIDYISEPYLHFAFSRGWHHWTAKHQIYAKRDAMALLDQPFPLRALVTRHASKRNMAIKRLVRRAPGWPLWRFIYTYFLKAGFLEGKQGLEYCRRMMWYERQIQHELALLNAGD